MEVGSRHTGPAEAEIHHRLDLWLRVGQGLPQIAAGIHVLIWEVSVEVVPVPV